MTNCFATVFHKNIKIDKLLIVYFIKILLNLLDRVFKNFVNNQLRSFVEDAKIRCKFKSTHLLNFQPSNHAYKLEQSLLLSFDRPLNAQCLIPDSFLNIQLNLLEQMFENITIRCTDRQHTFVFAGYFLQEFNILVVQLLFKIFVVECADVVWENLIACPQGYFLHCIQEVLNELSSA